MAELNDKTQVQPQKIVYSALKPTGDLQLGNYIGALKNMVKLQEDYKCIYTVADMHSITVDNVPADLRRRTYDFMALFLSIGLDPEKSTLFVQSHVHQHAELAWVLNCYTQFGEASRMTQFKEKSQKAPENVNLGLFAYPTLMAADILLYQADYVPIGKDQKQHLELARDVAGRFNTKYSPTFVIPEGIFPKQGAKIYNLLDPTAKMGKTDDNSAGVVFLLDNEDKIKKKFKRAVTDCGSDI
ncbi:MAG: tryptophan--tRNA ligase, partial [Clostridia bacterium]|nr:tryptophan--tRNA ligase [Clostridia bacterium]